MCYVCEIDNQTVIRDGSITCSADTAFADQFRCELRDAARREFNFWLQQRGVTVVLDPEQLAVYDELFMMGARCAVRILEQHELVKMLEERER